MSMLEREIDEREWERERDGREWGREFYIQILTTTRSTIVLRHGSNQTTVESIWEKERKEDMEEEEEFLFFADRLSFSNPFYQFFSLESESESKEMEREKWKGESKVYLNFKQGL